MYVVKVNGRIVFQSPNLVLANYYNQKMHSGKGTVKKK